MLKFRKSTLKYKFLSKTVTNFRSLNCRQTASVLILIAGGYVLFFLVNSEAFAETVSVGPGVGVKTVAITSGVSILVALLTGLISFGVARQTSISTIKSERDKRQGDLAIQISMLLSSNDKMQRAFAMKRFAVGVVKVISGDEKGIVRFVPMNSRVNVGREEENDIVLGAEDKTVSRWHCGFIADQRRVFLDDYLSTNGTMVGNERIDQARILLDGDEITIGQRVMKFHYIKANSLLST